MSEEIPNVGPQLKVDPSLMADALGAKPSEVKLVSGPTIKVDPPLANLIVRYANKQANMPTLNFPQEVTSIGEIGEVRGILQTVDSGELVLLLEGTLSAAIYNKGQAHVNLDDGSTVESQYVLSIGHSTKIASEYNARGFFRVNAITEIRLHGWRWATNTMPIAWIGILHGATFGSSNLFIQGPGSSSLDSLRLKGNAAWHLVRKGVLGGRACIAIIEKNPDCGDNLLADDFETLEFLFGSPLRLDLLIGVDEQGTPVAAFGTSFGYRFRSNESQHPPIPNSLMGLAENPDPKVLTAEQRHTWLAVAFPLVVKALSEESSQIRPAICAYVSSTIGYLESQYLLAQVALEAFANKIKTDEDARPIVRDSKSWKDWVESIDKVLQAHAVEDGLSLGVLNNKLISASNPTTSHLVQRFFNRFGLRLESEGLEEIKKRGTIVHTLDMANKGEPDFDKVLRRIRIIRVLLAAMILRYVGYEGALNSWELNNLGWPRPSDWFPVSDAAKKQADLMYEASVT